MQPLLASGAVNVDFDFTFLLHFVLFTTFVVVLKPILFDPIIRVFEERERRTDGARSEARAMDADVATMQAKYDAELERVRAEAGRERDGLRAETAKLEAEILAEARVEVAKILETGKAQLEREVQGLRSELARQEPVLAAQIAGRVLGRELTS